MADLGATDRPTGAPGAPGTQHGSQPAAYARGISVSYGGTPILNGVDLDPLYPGTVTALVGPNGAGKSTFLRCLAGLEKCAGDIAVDKAVYLPQDPLPLNSLTVYESVLLARQQSFKGFAGLRVGHASRREVEAALTTLGLEELASRTLAQLSGGQRQLVSFAQAMVRQPRVLLLDEPTSALDLRNQLLLLHHIQHCAADLPCAVVLTLHDLGHAARFCTRIIVLRQGHIHSAGSPGEVITPAMLEEVYGVKASVHPTKDGGLAVEASQAL